MTLVRVMVETDVKSAAALCRTVMEETWPHPSTLPNVITDYGEASWERYLATRRCFAAERNGELLGVAWVFVADGTAYVGGAFVAARGQGIGRSLLHARLDYARASGCTLAHAKVQIGNEASRRNLEGAGFTISEQTDRAWTLTRPLDPVGRS